jgi:hypothetical protein
MSYTKSPPSFTLPGVKSSDTHSFRVPNVPKVTYQDPQSISTNYAWSLPVDFVLPRTLGKVLDMVLQIDVTVSNGATTQLPPTPYWFERLETSIGGSAPIETVNKDELFMESLMFLNVQDFQTVAPTVNMNADGTFNASALTSGRYFLPLWANCLNTAQPYLKGFNSEWKLRFVLSNNQPSTFVGSGTVTVTGLRLMIIEATLAPEVELRLAKQHQVGITYNTVNRVRHVDTKAITAADNEFTLTTFGNESAGMLFYIRAADNSGDYSKVGKRAAASYVNMRDAQGNPYYATNLDSQFNLAYLQPWSIAKEPIQGLGTVNTSLYNYLVPFSAHLGAVLEDGRDLGAYQLSGREKAVMTLTSSDVTNMTSAVGSNPNFVAVSYDYIRIVVKNGQFKVLYNRG